MNILITGASGFAGRYLSRYLAQVNPDASLYGTTLLGATPSPEIVSYISIELQDADAVTNLLQSLQPTQIFHLAAQSSVPDSFRDPWNTYQNNIKAQLNILEAARVMNPIPKILVVASSEMYGHVMPEDLPVNESTPLRPANPYSVSKVTQDLMAYQMHLSYDLPIVRARPFNHFGAGQVEKFVATAFAMQIARIEQGLQNPIVSVGNLTAKRDFTDVRDVVRAYHDLIEHGRPGEVYNIASGNAHSIQYLLDTLLQFSTAAIEVQTDPTRMRPSDVPVIEGDASKLRALTGWEPTIPFEESLLNILNDCRQRVGDQGK